MAEVASRLTHADKFDTIIVDEAQDFADDWWHPLLGALRDEDDGGLYAYSDERQRVFARFGRPPVQLIPLVLDDNLRNTRQIAETFVALAPTGMELRGGEGSQVTFVPASWDEALDVADEQVEVLFEEGWAASDIALITLGQRHRCRSSARPPRPTGLLGAVLGHRRHLLRPRPGVQGHGTPRGGAVRQRGRPPRPCLERLYVGLSRATDRLIVVGDPDAIGRMGGADVPQPGHLMPEAATVCRDRSAGRDLTHLRMRPGRRTAWAWFTPSGVRPVAAGACSLRQGGRPAVCPR